MVNTTQGLELLTVQAESYEKCLEKIRNKYGTSYHLFSRGTVRCSGLRGLLGKEEIEVKYYLTKESRLYNSNEVRPVGSLQDFKVAKTSLISDAKNTPTDNNFESEKQKILSGVNRKLPNPELREVLEQLTALREELSDVKTNSATEDHETLSKIESLLEKNEFSIPYIKKILERVRKEFSLDELDNFNEIQSRVVEWIGESFSVTTVDNNTDNHTKPHVVIVVGPTGVGKTTTVAKLAANFVMQSDMLPRWNKVRIITIDQFRVAAIEQITNYAKYLEIPVSTYIKPEEIKREIFNYRDETDVFIIDTIGYSPKDYESIAKMRRILNLSGISTDVYLAFSASVKTSDLRDILKQYEIFDINSVIVTKFDETNHIGNIISVLSETNKPVVFITNGQKVPLDIEKATIIRFLIQLTDFNIDRDRIEKYFSTEMGEINGRSSI